MDFLLLVVVPVIVEKNSHPFWNVLKRLNFQLIRLTCISRAMKLVEK